ncbi:MAG TPA: hypothetical protein VMS08_04325 [Candidatus Saccharimonadia bacterium]|nr:hypothetical protein [Candidatus Saccharimonadia bacterium]
MKLIRLIGALYVAVLLAPVFIGTASADTAAVATTGPNSDQLITESNSVNTDLANVNDVQVDSSNGQQASTGNVSAQSNTSVGSAGSGNGSNRNNAATAVQNGNLAVAQPGLGGSSASAPVVASQPGRGPGGKVAVTLAPGLGGSVLGASTIAASILPVTGPSVPVDVSAIRAAWHPQNGVSPSSLVKHTSVFTAAMLITATLLSLLGAAGSAMYIRRQERRV